MTATRSAIIYAVVGMVLIGTLPGIVLAQDLAGQRLLNEQATTVATIEVDGQTYQVNRYENTLPYTSGIAVYHDGERVDSNHRAKTILTALAHRRAAEEIGPTERRMLRTLAANVTEARNSTRDAQAALNRSIHYLDTLRNTTVDGDSAWNRTVAAAPVAADYAGSAREAREDLAQFQAASADFADNVSTLVELLDENETQPRQRYHRYAVTMDHANTLAGDLGGFYSLSKDLRKVANTSERIANNASSVPEVGDTTETRFSRAATQTRDAAARIDAVPADLHRDELDATTDRAETLKQRYLTEWRARNNVTFELYGTIFGLPLIGAVVLSMGWYNLR